MLIINKQSHFSDKVRHASSTLGIIGVVIQFFHMHTRETSVEFNFSLLI